ncbi:MAG: hypothetical protein OEV89_00990 [Desulfobulbaceae bacterium]|nr:hypothetical protein [Desulfobulbaceae bacterium]HIJ89419.1 hypothetical protein [Deltaproteobacteria bacterium]
MIVYNHEFLHSMAKKRPQLYQRRPFKELSLWVDYFFALQVQPHPEDFSSFLIMQSLPPQSPHFFGLHLPSLVAPHFSHLNIAMLRPPVLY